MFPRRAAVLRGEYPTFAPFSINNLTTSMFPRRAAVLRGEYPTFAPFSINNLTTSMCPECAADWRGVHPLSLCGFTFAPFSNNNLTTSTRPEPAAKCKGLSPKFDCTSIIVETFRSFRKNILLKLVEQRRECTDFGSCSLDVRFLDTESRVRDLKRYQASEGL